MANYSGKEFVLTVQYINNDNNRKYLSIRIPNDVRKWVSDLIYEIKECGYDINRVELKSVDKVFELWEDKMEDCNG